MPTPVLRPAWEEVEAIRGFLETERIAPGARLLDVPCGIGRRAVGLAEAGYDVVAVDPNEVAIAAAKDRTPPEVAGRLTFASAPREALPGLRRGIRFDAILCLDHPIGRLPAGDDAGLLRRLATYARRDTVLVLDLLNRDFFASRPRPFALHTIGSVEQHEFRSFDPIRGALRLEWKFYERVGQDLKYRTESTSELVLFTPQDLAALLESSGWTMEGLWGGWGREPLNADRRKLVAAARCTETKKVKPAG